MAIDVSEAIDSDTADITSFVRQASGGYVDGLYVKGSETILSALISVQKPDKTELSLLPEGERQKDPKKFISSVELLTGDDKINQLPDLVMYRGGRYKIIKSADWMPNNMYKAYGVRE